MYELQHLREADRILVRHLLDLGEKAVRDREAVRAGFLDPRQREIVNRETAVIPGLRRMYYGGYHGAERQRLVLVPDTCLIEAVDPELSCLEISINSTVELSHADYLGALMNMGVKRDKMGDLIMLSGKCQLVVAADIQPFIEANLLRVGQSKATVKAIEPEQLEIPPEREKEIRATVSSPRLDAVAADGFGVSRTRMVKEIKAGHVRLNWQIELHPDKLLQQDDVISLRGHGRVIVAELGGQTKKGRLGLVLKVQK